MATVTVFTAERMLAIEANTVVSGRVSGNDLLLTTRAGDESVAGNVRGPKGDKGDPGLGSVSTVNGDFGPNVVLDAAKVGAVPATQYATTSARGIAELATSAEALSLSDTERIITPSALGAVGADRWERTASTVAALGSGRYTGETAVVLLGSPVSTRLLVFWNGVAWAPTFSRMTGTEAQRDLITGSGLSIDGLLFKVGNNAYLQYYANLTLWASQEPFGVFNIAGNIPNNTNSVLTGWVETSDIWNWRIPAPGPNPTRFTPTFPGYYTFTMDVTYGLNTTGLRVTFLRRNNNVSNLHREVVQASADQAGSSSVHLTDYFNGTSDYIEGIMFQNSGAALDITARLDGRFLGVGA